MHKNRPTKQNLEKIILCVGMMAQAEDSYLNGDICLEATLVIKDD